MANDALRASGQQKLGIAAVFVGRPVLALVVNLLVIIAGAAALNGVEIRELPNVSQPVISVSASYPGAAAETVDAEVTRVLEDALARLEGLVNISATSSYGSSRLTLELSTSTDITDAANDARDLVSRALRNLPDDLDEPTVQKSDADADPILRLALSGSLPLTDLASLAEGIVSDRLLAIDGVAEVQIAGDYDRIMRVTFSPVALASRGISLADMRSALASANLDIPLGALETSTQALIVRSVASATTEEAISNIRLNRETVVGDVAFVQLTSDDPTVMTRINGQPGVGINVVRQSHANTLTISTAARKAVATLQEDLPDGANLIIVSDDGVFVERSIFGVVSSIALAIVIVVAVIFLFLRSLRAVVVPAVAVPIALIGTVSAIWAAGFSVNTITLLALVLATGMVVDDAIVVLENIVRKRREGLGPFAAAAVGTREVFFAVISTTATLAAVFIPISFLPGQAGGIFGEFGFVLAFAVALSSFVALTLSPALCAFLDPGKEERNQRHQSDVSQGNASFFMSGFERLIALILRLRFLILAVSLIFAASSLALYGLLPQEITPSEDRGTIMISLRTPTSASLEYTSEQVATVEKILEPYVESGEALAVQSLIGLRSTNFALVFVRLAQWEDRSRTQQQIAAEIRPLVSRIPGAIIALRSPNSLGIRGAGSGVQFAVVGKDFNVLGGLTETLIEEMQSDPTFSNPQLVNEVNQPQLLLEIDRVQAANLGIAPRDVVETLNTVIEGDQVAEVFFDNEGIDIQLEAGGRPINDQSDLENTFLRASNGQFLPISTVATLSVSASSASLSREERERAVSAQANLGRDVDLGTAVERLKQIAPDILGTEGRLIFLGEAATLDDGEATTLLVFAAALLVVFLVLSAQFESFSSALIILITVPCGLGTALLAILFTGGSLNYFSQIGLVILVGIMAKNGILIVEFANQLRQKGQSVDEAIRNAMSIRLQPVLMTMASTVAGSIPLVLATGAGAEARIAVGWVVVGGLGLATIFTLFLTPAVYRIIAGFTDAPGATETRLERELAEET
ncbi:efflux RND transporter permease subunit [uncultured Roseibium sp.]|uniref:efflux RND transporter permease subunit n=1 Tax=uncultured Roseibium sp. TaxID=1936171 RepID=UPI0026227DD5|nr:efflux RND transporter permease subunit [uncultured Roseibium sp.]